jgi:hypothetical protein
MYKLNKGLAWLLWSLLLKTLAGNIAPVWLIDDPLLDEGE